MKKKILITGSSGFIGSHIISGISPEQFEIYELKSDLLDFKDVSEEIRSVNPNIVIHLAAKTEVQYSFYNQTEFSQVNYVGSVNLIESIIKQCDNFENFVFASTMEVYGWQPISDEIKKNNKAVTQVAFDENTEPHPNAPYSVAKLAVEKYIEYVSRTHNFPYTIIRQTNTYGRKDNDFFVTEQIITQMLKNKNEINLGYAYPYRNFLYIDDLVEAWLCVIQNTDKVRGNTYTLGPNEPIQINEYADIIAKKIEWYGKINWDTKQSRPGEIYWLNSNNNLITKHIGWTPKTSLNDGLDKTISHWKTLI